MLLGDKETSSHFLASTIRHIATNQLCGLVIFQGTANAVPSYYFAQFFFFITSSSLVKNKIFYSLL